MKKIERILRFLFIRLIFMAYCLLCIWRVLHETKQNYYLFLLVFVIGIVFETGLMLWLHSARELDKIMPSTLLFLLCVIPCIFMTVLNEAQLKQKFQKVANKHENEIKEFVVSLELSKDPFKSQLKSGTTTSTYAEDLLWKNIIPKSYEDITRKTPYYDAIRKQLEISKKKEETVECCVVKVSYWFQEDIWQRVYFQLLLIVIIISRWLITQANLKITQRLIRLMVTIVVTIDILFFFNLFLMEPVYNNVKALYAILIITSMSLFQFVFLFIENTLYPIGKELKSVNLEPGQMSFIDLISGFQNSETDNSDMMYDNNMLKNFDKKTSRSPSKRQSALLYELTNRRLQSTSAQDSECGLARQCKPNKDNYIPDCFVITLSSGLILHEIPYLIGRTILIISLGLNGTFNREPTLYFFTIKNLLVAATHFYRLSKHFKKQKQIRMYERLNSILTASGQPSKSCIMPKINCISLPPKNNVIISPPPDYVDSKPPIPEHNRNYEKNIAHKKFCAKNYPNHDKSIKNYRPMANTGVNNYSYNLTYNSCSSGKTTESEPNVMDFLAEIKNRQKQKIDYSRQISDTDMSIETPVSPISAVQPTPFNPFSAARIGNGIYGMSQFTKKLNSVQKF